MVTRRMGGGSLPSLQRRCLHQQLVLIAIVALLFLVVDSVYGFGSSNYQRISQHHHADPKLLLTTTSSSPSSGRMACNNDSPLIINSYSNKQSSSITTLYAKKQPSSNNKNNNEEDDDNKVMGIFNSKSPGTLLIAPFVILFGLDLILNIAAITRRSLEYVLTGQLPSNTPWGG